MNTAEGTVFKAGLAALRDAATRWNGPLEKVGCPRHCSRLPLPTLSPTPLSLPVPHQALAAASKKGKKPAAAAAGGAGGGAGAGAGAGAAAAAEERAAEEKKRRAMRQAAAATRNISVMVAALLKKEPSTMPANRINLSWRNPRVRQREPQSEADTAVTIPYSVQLVTSCVCVRLCVLL